ncbi:putative adenosine transporter [Trypanosoma vivax]|uniref:Adenosine transporter, putative n=1 Tax=Trypanosoma vivax (strain Y486) TaxID=1055687 RepID=F9WV62_TRYVY|nr:putative adenosine transporter [Trypanosoma vivax]CCD21467.1 adenosine transporter, putative [Trypanosoma vivax Y486]|eukprot:CCD21467.1 adenosine transporter, putative [Trypanosoma vivax Y486]
MGLLGFESPAAFVVYLSFLSFGMSLMLSANAVYCLYKYFTHFYKLVQGDPEAKPEDERFWTNIYTYYNVIIFSTQVVAEIFMLTPVGRRIPLHPRLCVGFALPFFQLLSYMMATTFHTTEAGAKTLFLAMAFVNGLSKSFCGSSTVALAGPFPTRFIGAYVFGLPLSGVITSILSMSIQGSMSNDFNSLLTQSYIYFSTTLAFQVIACVLLFLLPKNPYALRYAAELRYAVRKNNAGGDAGDKDGLEPLPTSEPVNDGDQAQPVVRSVLDTTVDPDTMKDTDQVENTTNAEQMLKAEIWVVVKRIYPILATCFLVYCSTLLFWPGVFIAVDPKGWNFWYTTIMMAMFNFGDFFSRLQLQFKNLHPSPRTVIIGAFARLLIIVPLFLCQKKVIEGNSAKVLCLFLSLFWGLSNGVCGGMMIIYGPRTASLTTAGQRSIAGICNNVSLLMGLFLGSAGALGLEKHL